MLYRRLIIEWAIVAICTTLAVALFIQQQLARPLDEFLLDSFSSLQPAKPDPRIILVEIDDASLKAMGNWPWRRSVHANLLDHIAQARPAAIAYDVLLLEPTADDAILARSMRQASPVYLPILPPRPETDGAYEVAALPPEVIANAAAGLGAVDIASDPDGIVRHFATGSTNAPHLVELLVPRAHQPPTTAQAARRDDAALLILHYAPAGAYPSLSFASLLDGSAPADMLKGKIVLVGGTAAGFSDRFPVPSYAGKLQSGIELQANILSNLLSGTVRRALPLGWQIGLGIAPVWMLLVAFLRFSPTTNLRLSLLAIGGTLLLSAVLLLGFGWWFPPAATLIGLVLVYSLWGWRRLAAVGDYLTHETRLLSTEPDLMPAARGAALRGDSITVDVDRLHSIISQLRALRRFIAEVLARLPDAVCVVDEQDEVMLGNLAADALFGCDVRGKTMGTLLARLDLSDSGSASEISLNDGRTLVVTRAPLTSGGTIVRLADISELRRASREREAALAFLSHDMRAPHAAIIALLESPERQQAAGGAPAPLPDTIRLHAERGLKLADDFVELAKLDHAAIDLHPVDLCGCAAEAIDLAYPLLRRRQVSIVESGLDVDIWVNGEEALLIRAILNLLDNAIKFSPEGGTVFCTVTISGGMASLSVRNEGPPLPPERRADPFLSFAQGRDTSDRVSRGLGLAFVSASIARQGGKAHYRDVSETMREYSLSLPVLDMAAEPPEDA